VLAGLPVRGVDLQRELRAVRRPRLVTTPGSRRTSVDSFAGRWR
jgi:hypothetical protein